MRSITLTGVSLLLLCTSLTAQRSLADPSTFRRPKLEAGADTNSWLAYYNYGIKHLRYSPDKAAAAFVWASRIDPTSAEPLYGRAVAYWRRYPKLFWAYLNRTPGVRESPQIRQVDSLVVRAMLRNPFFRRDADVVLYEQISGGPYSWTLLGRAILAYGDGRYLVAARLFSDLVSKDSVEYYWARFDIALCYTATHQYDSAAAQIATLVEEIHRRAEARLNPVYQSREILLYGLGVLRLIVGDTAAARENLGQALTENLAFHPAHALLADIALARADTVQAVAEYVQAVELDSTDGVLHYRYARVLGAVGRLPDAESEFRRAVELEPFFAPPYLGLALVLDISGKRAEALEQYRRYLQRTYRNDPRIAMAQERIKALSQ